MTARTALVYVMVASGALLYCASDWWERAYATYDSSEISPDGCIRIDTYEPFWILPSMFHRIPDPDPTVRHDLGMQWDAPIFKRAYEVGSGTFLGETVVFEPAGQNIIFWNEARKPGRRILLANGFPLVDSERCSDEATLKKLDAFHERQREANQAMAHSWERERGHADGSPEPNR